MSQEPRRLLVEKAVPAGVVAASGGTAYFTVSEFDVDDEGYLLLWDGACLAGVFMPGTVQHAYFAAIEAGAPQPQAA